MIKITTNPNKQLVAEIRAQLKDNDNHCPCSPIKDDSTLCMCRAFRDKIDKGEEGECHCGLYHITITND